MDPNSSQTQPTTLSPTPPVPETKKPSSLRQTIPYLLGAIVLLIIIIGAIYFVFTTFLKSSQQNQSATSNSQIGIDSQGGTPLPTQSGPKTHTSERYGWSIVYPDGIYLTQIQVNPGELDDNILESADFSSQSPNTPASASQTDRVNLSVHTLEESAQNLESITRNISSRENETYQLGGATVTPITVNGIEGYQVVIEGNSEISGWTDIYLPGKNPQNIMRIRYYLTGDGLKSTAEKMVSSFKIN